MNNDGGVPPRWAREGRDWPNRSHSRFVGASAIQWHVQRFGDGPILLALHGTGASTHSWRDLAPALSAHFTVIAVDLPGHGFTERPAMSRMTLPGMSTALAELLDGEGWVPSVVIGHSAGAAIACRMALDQRVTPNLIVGLNAALRPFGGSLAPLYGLSAKVTSMFSPVVASLIAARARDLRTIRDLVEQTGSRLDQRGLRLYQRLVSNPAHTESALAMMARWSLTDLEHELGRLPCEILLVAGARDAAVPPAHALHLAGRLPRARAVIVPDVGHLSHEEQPEPTATLIVDAARKAGVLLGSSV